MTYILLATLFSFGWCALFNEGMIFERVGKALARLPEWLKKPLFDCPRCNSFWVTTVMFFTIWPPMEWWKIPLIGGCCIGLADIILSIQANIKHISEAIDEQGL